MDTTSIYNPNPKQIDQKTEKTWYMSVIRELAVMGENWVLEHTGGLVRRPKTGQPWKENLLYERDVPLQREPAPSEGASRHVRHNGSVLTKGEYHKISKNMESRLAQMQYESKWAETLEERGHHEYQSESEAIATFVEPEWKVAIRKGEKLTASQEELIPWE